MGEIMNRKTKKSTLLISLLVIVTISIIIFGYYSKQKKKEEFVLLQDSYINKNNLERQPEVGKIFIKGKPNDYKIFLKGTGKSFIGYNFERSTKELDKTVSSSNYDTWNVNTASKYSFLEDLSEFKEIGKVITTGEWEMAIKEVNASDFSGGKLHGDEVLDSFKIVIDGEDYTDKAYNGNATTFEAEVISDVFRDNTTTNEPELIATHSKKYLFDISGLTLNQKVEFNEEIEVDIAYLGMLPVDKNVADSAYINEVYYDISTEYTNVERTYSEEVTIKNEDESVETVMSVLENDSPQEMKMMVVNTDNYNKIYSIFLEKPYTTYPGEVWNQTTYYSLVIHN